MIFPIQDQGARWSSSVTAARRRRTPPQSGKLKISFIFEKNTTTLSKNSGYFSNK
jgi:hypothetical protein